MRLDVTATLSAFGVGTMVGSVVTLLVKDHLIRKAERRRQRIETDRATYQERMTRLIAANLCAFIRSNRYRECERQGIAELIQNLSDGEHQQCFLDEKTQAAWTRLVKLSAECGWRRFTNVITEQDIAEYTRAWEEWLIAARDAFGPLPEKDPPPMRRSDLAGSLKEAV
jgi:hypothetical protein